MTVAVHVVTTALPPVGGGLETWTHELVNNLGACGFRVIVYVCGDGGEPPGACSYNLVDIAGMRSAWEAPLLATRCGRKRLTREQARLNVVLLRAAIGKEVAAHPDDKHCVLSNFALGIGHHAMIVSRDLDIPHVATVVGTDFSRGFRNPVERAALSEICATAWCVVCKSSEQLAALKRDMPPSRYKLIPTSVRYPARGKVGAGPADQVRLLADCGASYKKGTIVVLESFRRLLSAGQPVSLTLCGGIAEGQDAYWRHVLDATAAASGPAFSYLGHISRDQVHVLLCDSSVYCSASLGEGSSAARLAALCCGIPVVTTRCGEFALDVSPMSHVRLVEVGDARGFEAELGSVVAEVRAGSVSVDWLQVEECRRRFGSDAEWSAWKKLLSAAGASA